jgi:hypothetical protein
MLLFRGEEHIESWRTQWNQPRGATLTIDQAWQLADAWYRDKMDADWRRATIEETEVLLGKLALTGPFWSLRT